MDLEALQKDEEFKTRIENAETFAEVIEIFKSKGLEVTESQLRAVVESEGSDELTENMLDEVAGGRIILPWPGFPKIPGIWPPKPGKRPWWL